MTASRRFLLVGLVVGAAEAVLAVLALPTGLGPYLFACGAATVALAFAARRLLAPRPPGGPDDERRGDGGPPEDPPQPPWWPEFEAAFRAYARERGRPRAGT